MVGEKRKGKEFFFIFFPVFGWTAEVGNDTSHFLTSTHLNPNSPSIKKANQETHQLAEKDSIQLSIGFRTTRITVKFKLNLSEIIKVHVLNKIWTLMIYEILPFEIIHSNAEVLDVDVLSDN